MPPPHALSCAKVWLLRSRLSAVALAGLIALALLCLGVEPAHAHAGPTGAGTSPHLDTHHVPCDAGAGADPMAAAFPVGSDAAEGNEPQTGALPTVNVEYVIPERLPFLQPHARSIAGAWDARPPHAPPR